MPPAGQYPLADDQPGAAIANKNLRRQVVFGADGRIVAVWTNRTRQHCRPLQIPAGLFGRLQGNTFSLRTIGEVNLKFLLHTIAESRNEKFGGSGRSATR